MSTSVLYHAFQVEGVKYKSTSYEGSCLIFNAEMNDRYLKCPRCHSLNISINLEFLQHPAGAQIIEIAQVHAFRQEPPYVAILPAARVRGR